MTRNISTAVLSYQRNLLKKLENGATHIKECPNCSFLFVDVLRRGGVYKKDVTYKICIWCRGDK